MPLATDSIFQTFGGLDLPVTADDVTTTFAPLDPARTTLIELFKAAINLELGEAWTDVIAGLPATHPLKASLTPVVDTLEIEPTPVVMTQRKPAWPLLILHRSGTGLYEQHTFESDRLTQPWVLHYILGPLDVADVRIFGDVPVAVAKIVRMVIRNRGHKAYESGVLQFFDDDGLAQVELKSHIGPGAASFAEADTSYFAITMQLETVEIVTDKEGGYGQLDGATYEVGVGGGEGLMPSLVLGDTDATQDG